MANSRTMLIKKITLNLCSLLSYFVTFCKYILSLSILDNNNNNQELNMKNEKIKSMFNHKKSEKYISSYLAGLIEGDGYISITNENRIILGITFNLKDKPLAEKLLLYLGKGTIVKRKTNSIELRFSAKSTLLKIVNLINGKFRTPKIDQLYKLID